MSEREIIDFLNTPLFPHGLDMHFWWTGIFIIFICGAIVGTFLTGSSDARFQIIMGAMGGVVLQHRPLDEKPLRTEIDQPLRHQVPTSIHQEQRSIVASTFSASGTPNFAMASSKSAE